MPQPTPTLLEDAIEIPLTLEVDRSTPFDARLKRDRTLARRLPTGDALAIVRAWRRQLPEAAATDAGAWLERWRTLVGLGMVVLGALAGGGLALAAFQYDGSYPVNVVRLLGLLVALPLGLMLATLLLIPRRLPGLRPIQDLVAAINPGALGAAIVGRLAKDRPGVARLLDPSTARSGAARRFAKWQLVCWSQLAGVGFGVACLATAAGLIAFTDLAFGWSTTLAVDAGLVHRIAAAIALPWHTVVPDAVPSLALVEQSQYFRLDAGANLAPAAPRVLTGWWPFTLLAIATYTLLPRLVFLGVAVWRLRAATAALLLDNAEVTALLDRLAMPAVETASTEPAEPLPQARIATHARAAALSGRAAGIIWSGGVGAEAAGELARDRFGVELAVVAEAGRGALDDDRAAIERLAAAAPRTVIVFVAAWEPPLLEFLDFLAAARRRLGAEASIVVTLIAEGPRQVTDVERSTWEQAIAKSGDAGVYVETGSA